MDVDVIRNLLLFIDYYIPEGSVLDNGFPADAFKYIRCLSNNLREAPDHVMDVTLCHTEDIFRQDITPETGTIISVVATRHIYTLAIYAVGDEMYVDLCNAGQGSDDIISHGYETPRANILACAPLMRRPYRTDREKTEAVESVRAFLGLGMQQEARRDHLNSVLLSNLFPIAVKGCAAFYPGHRDAWRWASRQTSGACYMRNVLLAYRAILVGSGRMTLDEVFAWQSSMKIEAMRRLHAHFLSDADRALRIHQRFACNAMSRLLTYDLAKASDALVAKAAALRDEMHRAYARRPNTGALSEDAHMMMSFNGLFIRDMLQRMRAMLVASPEASLPTEGGMTIEVFGPTLSPTWVRDMEEFFVWGNIHHTHLVLNHDMSGVTAPRLHMEITFTSARTVTDRLTPLQRQVYDMLYGEDPIVLDPDPSALVPNINVDLFYALTKSGGAQRSGPIFDKYDDRDMHFRWASESCVDGITLKNTGDASLQTEADRLRISLAVVEATAHLEDLRTKSFGPDNIPADSLAAYMEIFDDTELNTEFEDLDGVLMEETERRDGEMMRARGREGVGRDLTTFDKEPPDMQHSNYATLPTYEALTAKGMKSPSFDAPMLHVILSRCFRVDMDALFKARAKEGHCWNSMMEMAREQLKVGPPLRAYGPSLVRLLTLMAEAVVRWAYFTPHVGLELNDMNWKCAARYEELLHFVLVVRIALVASGSTTEIIDCIEMVYDELRVVYIERLHHFSHIMSLRLTCDTLYVLDVLPFPFGRANKGAVDLRVVGKMLMLASQSCRMVGFTPRVGIYVACMMRDEPDRFSQIVSGLREGYGGDSSAPPRVVRNEFAHIIVEVPLTSTFMFEFPVFSLGRSAEAHRVFAAVKPLNQSAVPFDYGVTKKNGVTTYTAVDVIDACVSVQTTDHVNLNVIVRPPTTPWTPTTPIHLGEDRSDEMSPPTYLPTPPSWSMCERVAYGIKPPVHTREEAILPGVHAFRTETPLMRWVSTSTGHATFLFESFGVWWNTSSQTFVFRSDDDEMRFIAAMGLPHQHFRFVGRDVSGEELEFQLKQGSSSPSWLDSTQHVVVASLTEEGSFRFSVKGHLSTNVIPSSQVATVLKGEHGFPTCFMHARKLTQPDTILLWANSSHVEAVVSQDGGIRIAEDITTHTCSLVNGDVTSTIIDVPTTLHPGVGVPYADYPGVWVQADGKELFMFSDAPIKDVSPPEFKRHCTQQRANVVLAAVMCFARPTTALHTMHVTKEGGIRTESLNASRALIKLCRAASCTELWFEADMTSGVISIPDDTFNGHHVIRDIIECDVPVPSVLHGTNFIRQHPIPSALGVEATPTIEVSELRTISYVQRTMSHLVEVMSKKRHLMKGEPDAVHVWFRGPFVGIINEIYTLSRKCSSEEERVQDFAKNVPLVEGTASSAPFEVVAILQRCVFVLTSIIEGARDVQARASSLTTQVSLEGFTRIAHNMMLLPLKTLPSTPHSIKEASALFPSPQAFREEVARKWSEGWADLYWPGASAQPRHISLVEMERGYSLRPPQRRIIEELVNKSNSDGISLRELIMGAGKSSAIIPALTLAVLSSAEERSCMVVVPPHLMESTCVLVGALVSKWLGSPPKGIGRRLSHQLCITDVNAFKMHVVKSPAIRFPHTTCLIDEHDSLTNPTTSELNITTSTDICAGALERIMSIRKILSWILRPHRTSSGTPKDVLDAIANSNMRTFPHNHFANVADALSAYPPSFPDQELYRNKIAPLLTQRMGVTFGRPSSAQVDIVPYKAKGIADEESRFEDFDVRATMNLIPRIAFGLSVGDVKALLWSLPSMQPYRSAELEWEHITKGDSMLYHQLIGFRGLDVTHQTLVAEQVHALLGRQRRAIHYINLFIRLVLLTELQVVPTKKMVTNGTVFCVTRYFDRILAMTGTPVVHQLFPDERDGMVALTEHTPEPGTVERIKNIFVNREIMHITKRTFPRDDMACLRRLTQTLTRPGSNIRAFIDAASTIVQIPSREVAKAIANAKPSGVHHVGFVEEGTFEKLAILVEGGYEVPLSGTEEHVDGRFMYFDQANTVGVDVKMPKVCVAILTVRDNMVLSTAAQAAYRMRNIGQGQQTLETWTDMKGSLYDGLIRNTTQTNQTHREMCVRQFMEMVTWELRKSADTFIQDAPESNAMRARHLLLSVPYMRDVVEEMLAKDDGAPGTVSMSTTRTTQRNTATGVTKSTQQTQRLTAEQQSSLTSRSEAVEECTTVLDEHDGFASGLEWRDEPDSSLAVRCLASAVTEETSSRGVLHDADTLLPLHVSGPVVSMKDGGELFTRFTSDAIIAQQKLGRSTLQSWDEVKFTATVASHTGVLRLLGGKDTTPFEHALQQAKGVLGVRSDAEFIHWMMLAAKQSRRMNALVDEEDLVRMLMLIVKGRSEVKRKLLLVVEALGLGDGVRERVARMAESVDGGDESSSTWLMEESTENTYVATHTQGWVEWLTEIDEDGC